jgi:hypothetical protein
VKNPTNSPVELNAARPATVFPALSTLATVSWTPGPLAVPVNVTAFEGPTVGAGFETVRFAAPTGALNCSTVKVVELPNIVGKTKLPISTVAPEINPVPVMVT